MKQAPYLPIPALSPYLDQARYKNPKRDFVNILKIMQVHIDCGEGAGSLIDLGCANGEFLYYLRENMGKGWKLSGLDFVPGFLEVARSCPELKDVTFNEGDITKVIGSYDVITCTGTMPIFTDIEETLETFLNATNDGGWLFLDGQFNPDDVDVIFQYRDNSKKEAHGKWRCDFNIHAQQRIAEFLNGRVKSFSFHPMPMDIDLPRKKDAPHINIYTLPLADGSRVKIHGGRLIIDTWLLVIQK